MNDAELKRIAKKYAPWMIAELKLDETHQSKIESALYFILLQHETVEKNG